MASTLKVASEGESESEPDDEEETHTHETDFDRRQTLLSSDQNDDLQGLRSGTLWDFFQKDSISGGQGASNTTEMPDDCNIGYSGATSGPSTSKRKRQHRSEDAEGDYHHPNPC